MKSIFVGNLSFGATEDQLRSVFEPYGAVERVSIITDRTTGQSRGFAFVEMISSEEADRAIASLDGHELNGRMMKVNEARPRASREFAGSGSRGSRGGGQRRFNRW